MKRANNLVRILMVAIACLFLLLISLSETLPGPTASAVSSQEVTWEVEGIRLRASDFDKPAGTVVADASAITLSDGRVRIYVGIGTAEYIGSAISDDGLSFTVESGERLLSASFPRVVVLSEGDYGYPEYKYRMFFQTSDPDQGVGVGSAVSIDGLDFSKEDGLRFRAADVGMDVITNPSIVSMADGGYRLYFSGAEDSQQPGGRVFSATSTDLYHVTVDSGVRVGIGAASVTGWAEHPSALLEPDGSVTLFYFRKEPPGMWSATSTDGLTFTSESDTGIVGNDPDVMRLPDGSLRVYYGGFDVPGEATIDSARSVIPSFSLTLETSSGGTTDPSPGTYTYDSGTAVTIEANSDTGYTFTGWSGDASGTTNPLTVTMDSDKSIKANFAEASTGNGGGGGGCFIATAAY